MLFRFGDAKELSKKIELIYEDGKLRNRLVKNGLESVRKYLLDDYLEKLNLIYGSMKNG